MPIPETIATIGAKLFWPFLGAILALIVIPPKTRTEAIRRGAASVIGGFVAGPTLHEWLGIADTTHNQSFALVLAAFVSWWILGVLPKIAARLASKDAG